MRLDTVGAAMTASHKQLQERRGRFMWTYTGYVRSPEMLESANGHSRKFAILFLEINKSPCVFISPKILTIDLRYFVMSINEI